MNTCKNDSVRAASQSNGRTRLKLSTALVTIGEPMQLWLPVLSGTCSTCHRGNLIREIPRVCKFLSWQQQTQHTGTPGQWHTTLYIKRTWGAHYIGVNRGARNLHLYSPFQGNMSIHRLQRVHIWCAASRHGWARIIVVAGT